MACRLIEGWESSTTTSHYTGKWTSFSGNGTAIQTTGSRSGTGQYLRVSGTLSPLVTRAFGAAGTWVLGFAFRTAGLGAQAVSLFDGASSQDDLFVNADGSLSVRRGSSTVLGTTTGVNLVAATWYYLEWKLVIGSGTSGSTEVRVNGVSRLALTGQNTQATANATATTLRLHQAPSNSSQDFDDMYVLDGTGGVNTDFLGDCKVEQLLPTGAGATTAWTPSAGSNWQCVDDAPPNGDTDYVSSATANQVDTYAFGDSAVTGTVKAVQATVYHRKDDAGSRSLALVARPGSTDQAGATIAVGDTFAMASQVWDTNPDTATAWTIATVNSSQFGLKLLA